MYGYLGVGSSKLETRQKEGPCMPERDDETGKPIMALGQMPN
jgi:hypothetical protein